MRDFRFFWVYDRILVIGSFHLAEPLLEYLGGVRDGGRTGDQKLGRRLRNAVRRP
jgi:hypothetical protein